jgi:hypothetical protein
MIGCTLSPLEAKKRTYIIRQENKATKIETKKISI